ncbi:ATP-binding cassette domain-containing protein [bacterium]|nr:ATP-binding cassette domain-containing protein [bacterium]
MSIVLKELSKRYNETLVVNRVSLGVEKGELFVLLGPSGSGKSTILRMIAGLTRPDAGTIEINEKNVTSLPAQQRGAGFVFQNYSLFRHMTVADNVEFGLKVRKVSPAERRSRRDDLLDLVGLGGLGNRFPHQLSGGQQQRVALARALAYNPAVLLLDEPFGALDVKIRGRLRKNLKDIHRQLKLTTILVTHDQEEAFELADRIGVTDRGNLIEIGTPEELYHRPRTEYTANFVGGKNVLIGRVEGGVIRLGDTSLPVPERLSTMEGARVRILFRPENVCLQSEPFDNASVYVLGRGRILESVFAGTLQKALLEVERPRGIREYAGEFGDERTIRVEAVQTSDSDADGQLNPGDRMWIAFKRYHVLEAIGPKLLLCISDAPAAAAVANFGCHLAEKAGLPATLLSVVDSSESINLAEEILEHIRQKWRNRLPLLKTRVRTGSSFEEIIAESQEGSYDLVVLGRKETGRHVRSLLARGIAVVIAQEDRQISRILICTAVGEPGKADVRIGGRLARLTGASATVLHVPSQQQAEDQKTRSDLHIQQALSTLQTFGVQGDSMIGKEPAVDFIIEQAESGNYDLIVIGAPPSGRSPRFLLQDAASQIVNGTSRPVLIVPLME